MLYVCASLKIQGVAASRDCQPLCASSFMLVHLHESSQRPLPECALLLAYRQTASWGSAVIESLSAT